MAHVQAYSREWNSCTFGGVRNYRVEEGTYRLPATGATLGAAELHARLGGFVCEFQNLIGLKPPIPNILCGATRAETDPLSMPCQSADAVSTPGTYICLYSNIGSERDALARGLSCVVHQVASASLVLRS